MSIDSKPTTGGAPLAPGTYVVFDKQPGPEAEFAEIETEAGQGVALSPVRRDDGMWAFGPFLPATIETLERLAALAVEATMNDLLDRKAIGDAIEDVDPDVREDMTGDLHRAVLRAWGRA